MADQYRTFDEFWPYYLREHSNVTNRRLHFVGTTIVVAASFAWFLTLQPLALLAMPVAGYGFAWVGHFVVEKNRPATFTYPLWSLRADFRMYVLMLIGRLGPELDKARAAA